MSVDHEIEEEQSTNEYLTENIRESMKNNDAAV